MQRLNLSICDSGRSNTPTWSRGFCVAITKKGSGNLNVFPSIEICDSSIASSKADWVLDGARFISSTSKILVKIGPLINSIDLLDVDLL